MQNESIHKCVTQLLRLSFQLCTYTRHRWSCSLDCKEGLAEKKSLYVSVCLWRSKEHLTQRSSSDTHRNSLSKITIGESIGGISFSKFVTLFSRPRKGLGTESLKFIRVYQRDSGQRNRLVIFSIKGGLSGQTSEIIERLIEGHAGRVTQRERQFLKIPLTVKRHTGKILECPSVGRGQRNIEISFLSGNVSIGGRGNRELLNGFFLRRDHTMKTFCESLKETS